MIELEYSYSDFGLTRVPFYQESKEVIDFLEKVETGGLDHFDRLDHLGRLRDAHKSAHHSRWEYMMLQMYLCHMFKESGSSFGFGTSVKLDKNNSISSSAELLKCWTLLLNFGHLVGTFECERAWFELIKEDKELYEAFLKNLPDASTRRIARRVFSNEQYTKLHEIIAVLLLNHYAKNKDLSEYQIDKFMLMLEKYLVQDKRATTINRCKEVFRRIRRLAYILLDCSFSSSFVKINPKIYLDYLLLNSDEVLYEDYSSFNQILSAVDTELFNELYASEKASIIKFKYISRKKAELQEKIDAKRPDITKSLPEIIIEEKISDTITLEKTGPEHLLRLSFIPIREYFERSDCKYYTEQNSILKRFDLPGVHPFITPVPGAAAGSVLDILQYDSLSVKMFTPFIWTILKYIEEIYSESRFAEHLFQYCVEDAAEDILVFLLNSLLPRDNWKIRLKGETSPDDYSVNFLPSKKDIVSWTTRMSEELRETDISTSRRKELECLKSLLSREKSGMIVVSHCNVVICDENWSEKAELDSIYFRVLRRGIYATIIEAKKGITSRSDKAKNSLLKSLGKIGLTIDQAKVPVSTEIVPRKGVGFSYVSSNINNIATVES